MAPRAKPTEPTEPTRRSTRISAQPKAEPVKEVKKTAPRKKRTADDGEGEDASPAVKKVRVLFNPFVFLGRALQCKGIWQ